VTRVTAGSPRARPHDVRAIAVRRRGAGRDALEPRERRRGVREDRPAPSGQAGGGGCRGGEARHLDEALGHDLAIRTPGGGLLEPSLRVDHIVEAVLGERTAGEGHGLERPAPPVEDRAETSTFVDTARREAESAPLVIQDASGGGPHE
jgi:hypothetical protein